MAVIHPLLKLILGVFLSSKSKVALSEKDSHVQCSVAEVKVEADVSFQRWR